ncbi:lipopolysaccharide assembly protein LapA domain-containing protein [Pigmentiphaga soli]|uniref:Lipopolysaccharide assembly protein LapA domain-containing protein n=1 Tax=Pigmentiphaga soli TaxID=1007095 RepID=A0ABP8GXY7_9BURK
MRYLVWVLRLLVFVVVLLFALKNTEKVNVFFFADQFISEVPLIVVMLGSFVVGTVFGLLLTVPGVLRRRRETATLRRELERARAAAADRAQAADTAPSPDVLVPITPM